MTRPTILLDVDGVLRNFARPALIYAKVLGGAVGVEPDTLSSYDIASLIPESARDRWWKHVSGRGFCAQLQPYPGAAQVVAELRDLGNVVALTAPMRDGMTWEYESRRWLREHFKFHADDVISAPGKWWVQGEFFADDLAHNLVRWRDRCRWRNRVFLIERSYNAEHRDQFPRGSLRDFATYVREYLATQEQYPASKQENATP